MWAIWGRVKSFFAKSFVKKASRNEAKLNGNEPKINEKLSKLIESARLLITF